METEELTKLVDGIYKNILDKFNPGARQMIIAGKAYLKALHGAAAASRLYVEAITKLGRQAQQGTWGGSADIGTALMKVVEVYREIQDQQMNILKAFYVDLLVPLETNLEKDTKVVQSEQKRFLQQHKLRSESYSKAAAAMKRQRKKNTKSTKTSGLAMDKELKNMQILEEEKTKLDAFCEQSLKNAMTQERRRYGFVLERQCSLARHWLAYHAAGSAAYRSALDDWQEAARSREGLPPAVDAMFISKMRQVSFWADEDVYASPRAGGAASADELERLSVTSQLRKTRSMDASCLDVRSLDRAASPGGQPLSRAKSDFNISSSTHSLEDESLNATPTRRPRSMALPLNSSLLGASSAEPQLARALYAYLSSGDNQLSFLEGDVLALAGERTKGWQYGENVRTQLTGWFPLAYTEPMQEDVVSSPNRWGCPPVPLAVPRSPAPGSPGASSARSGGTLPPSQSTSTPVTSNGSAMAPRMFGDTLIAHRNSKQLRLATASTSGRAGPPPSLPAPVPAPTVPAATPAGHAQSANRMTQSHSATFHTQAPQQSSTPQGSAPGKASTMKTSTSSSATTGLSDVARVPQTLPARGTSGAMAGVQGSNPGQMKAGQAPVLPPAGNVSLHSSNDSGFSNEPPPQPEIDYSDEENATRHRIPIRNGQRRYEAQTNGHHTHSLQREHNNVRSMGNENGYGNERYLTDDQQIMLRTMMETDRDGQKIKRTKSFWKFGKSASEDILEGMALWRHRDLVDIVPQYKRRPQENEMINMQQEYRVQRPSNAESNENTLKRNMAKMSIGDKTLDRFEKHGIQKSKSTSSIMNHVENNKVEKKPQNKAVQKPIEVTQSKMQKQTSQQRMEEEYNSRNDRQSNNSDLTNSSTIKTNFENSFYDDENGEGLVVKTVKRKEILQQYDNESVSGSETERASIASSTDPYDCIIVDDHMALRKQRELENRRLQAQKQAQYNTNESSKKSRDKMMYASEISDSDNNGPIKPHLRATLSSERQKTSSKQQQQQANEQQMMQNQRVSTFKTFKTNESDLKMYQDSNTDTLKYSTSERARKDEKYYQNHETDSKKAAKNKKYYAEQQQKSMQQEQMLKRHYNEQKKQQNGRHTNGNYYNDQSDDHKYVSDGNNEAQKPQLLPRTKLLKQNSVGPTMQTVMKFEQEIGLMDYRSPPRERSSGKGHHQEQMPPPGDFMPMPGTTYGPWFDLWGGRDQSVRK